MSEPAAGRKGFRDFCCYSFCRNRRREKQKFLFGTAVHNCTAIMKADFQCLLMKEIVIILPTGMCSQKMIFPVLSMFRFWNTACLHHMLEQKKQRMLRIYCQCCFEQLLCRFRIFFRKEFMGEKTPVLGKKRKTRKHSRKKTAFFRFRKRLCQQ